LPYSGVVVRILATEKHAECGNQQICFNNVLHIYTFIVD
jgi:hypothetical protein